MKIKVSEIDSVLLVERRGYLTLILEEAEGETHSLRRAEGLKEWFRMIQRAVMVRKEERSRGRSQSSPWLERKLSKRAQSERKSLNSSKILLIQISISDNLPRNVVEGRKSKRSVSVDRRRSNREGKRMYSSK